MVGWVPAPTRPAAFQPRSAETGCTVSQPIPAAAPRALVAQHVTLLGSYAVERAIVHWYSGPLDTFQRLADRGTYFTVGAEVLYSEHIREIARRVPRTQLPTETDNPGGPRDFLGKPGMPLLIKDVVRKMAEVRGSSYDEVVNQTEENFLQLIGEDPELAQLAGRLTTVIAGGTQPGLSADREDAAAEG